MLEEGRMKGVSREGIGKSKIDKQLLEETQAGEKKAKNVNEDGCYSNGDENVLKFMDSLDNYLTLMASTSSILRQGWFDLASARYSMGASRINTALLDLNPHPAGTSIQVSRCDEYPYFTLQKWVAQSSEATNDAEDDLQNQSISPGLRNRGTSESTETLEESSPNKKPASTADARVQKERAKSLAMFGTLVPPKLRAAQVSFETALETLVEIVNMRSSMILAYDQVRRGTHHSGTKAQQQPL